MISVLADFYHAITDNNRVEKSLIFKSVHPNDQELSILSRQEVDTILDMIMDPGMDGRDTYKEILNIRKSQKAIIVSGFSESDRVKEARSLGAGAYLKKPYIKEKLGLVVRKELDRE